MRSMTGFAQRTIEENGLVLTVSLRSVNHRSFDLHLTLPDSLQRFEPEARREIGARQPRGHVQLKVALERESAGGPAVDEASIGRYIELFRGVATRHGLTLETAIQHLSHLPGVILPAGSHSPLIAPPEMQSAFLRVLRETLEDWDEMRIEEGAILEQDFRSRSEKITALIGRLEQLRQESVPVAQKKLQERLQTWVGENGMDAVRLAQEAAVLAERTDVSEELLRLHAHAAQFVALLDGQNEIGKRLDFLLQEMQRELNTLLAKTAGLGESGLAMTQVALEIKGEVEKLREQVQNVQ